MLIPKFISNQNGTLDIDILSILSDHVTAPLERLRNREQRSKMTNLSDTQAEKRHSGYTPYALWMHSLYVLDTLHRVA